MKFLVLLFGIIAISSAQLSPEQMNTIVGYFNDCKQESGAKIDMAAMFGKNIPNDPKAKDLMFCMGKKIGIQNEAGDIQKDEVRGYLVKMKVDESKVDEIIENCAVQKETPQETAFQGMSCVAKYMVK